jgi:hypothetical protein
LSTDDGLQLPVIPFVDVVVKVGTDAPAHMVVEVPKLNVGVIFGLTVTVNVVDVAHCPAVGVNVYTPEVALFTEEGLQLPEIPLVEEVGRVGTDPPAQIDKLVPKLNTGVVFGITVTVIVVGKPHCPAVGVNV